MIPLKKIFPVIVVLITLSLLGIIYIQVSWIRSAVLIKQEQLFVGFTNINYCYYGFFSRHFIWEALSSYPCPKGKEDRLFILFEHK